MMDLTTRTAKIESFNNMIHIFLDCFKSPIEVLVESRGVRLLRLRACRPQYISFWPPTHDQLLQLQMARKRHVTPQPACALAALSVI